jgi:hypothetical protein
VHAHSRHARRLRALREHHPHVQRVPGDATVAHLVTAPRFDAHIPNECTHWCLPGVPDVWVRLLYALLKAQTTASPVRQSHGGLRKPQYSAFERNSK